MNLFKKLFTKSKYKTVYSVSCRVNLVNMWGKSEKVDAHLILQIEEEYNDHRCYITDGEHITNYNVSLLAINCPDSIPILEKYHITY